MSVKIHSTNWKESSSQFKTYGGHMCDCKNFGCETCMARFMGKVIASATFTAQANGYETGLEDGVDIGQDIGHQDGHDEGYSQGLQIGQEQGYVHGEAYGRKAGFHLGQQATYSTAFLEGQQRGYNDGVNETLDEFADVINGNHLTDDIYNQGMEDGLSMVYDSAEGYLLSNGELVMKVGEMQPELPDGFELFGTMDVVVTYESPQEPESPKQKPKKSATKKPVAKKTTARKPKPKEKK